MKPLLQIAILLVPITVVIIAFIYNYFKHKIHQSKLTHLENLERSRADFEKEKLGLLKHDENVDKIINERISEALKEEVKSLKPELIKELTAKREIALVQLEIKKTFKKLKDQTKKNAKHPDDKKTQELLDKLTELEQKLILAKN